LFDIEIITVVHVMHHLVRCDYEVCREK